MNKSFFTKCAFIIMSSAFMFSSCMEKDVYKGEPQNQPLKPSEVFDFSLTKEIKVNIDYGFTNDYYVLFQLYDQDPMKLVDNSWVKDETLNPVYAASTDTKGQYSGTITIPSSITEVWLYSEYLGTVSPVKLTVSNGTVNYNQKEYIASLRANTRATTTNGFTYPDTDMLMPGVDWDQYGLPSNIEPDLCMPPADVLYSIKEVFSRVQNHRIYEIPERIPWTYNNATSIITITQPTEISLVFVGGGEFFNNSVGYFTYPSGTDPTQLPSIKKVLAFPNASPIYKTTKEGQRTGALVCGHEVKLKYWNEEKNEFEDEFPANTTLGWFMESNAFANGHIKGNNTRYSYCSMNTKYPDRNRIVALRDGSSNQIVAIGFEDNQDFDFADALFYLKVSKKNAIEGGALLPKVETPSNTENSTSYRGTLTFEDQWPSEGDYDMNDVVVSYKSTLYRQVISNRVYKIVDEFTPIHNGGTYTCGFGYQLHQLPADQVTSIQVEGSNSWQVETGQLHPTVILFDNLKDALGKKITVTTEVTDVDIKSVTPPYNPFIFVNGRGREVHMVNYPPTNKADLSLFGTADDASNYASEIYYISRYNKDDLKLMPFCINLANVTDFNIPAEGVRIYETYPGFVEWVNSDGKTNTKWYK